MNSSLSLSPDERDALCWIDAQGAALLERTLAWSAINSGSRNLAGLERMAETIGERLARLNGTVSLRDPTPASSPDLRGELEPLVHGRNLHFCREAPGLNRVLLCGHMDTVFAADHAFQAPMAISDRVIRGPGVADMKGGIAVMLAAVEAFLHSGLDDRMGIEIVVNADEEVSSLGSAALLAEAAARCTLGLAYEPSASPEGMLAGARKGSGNFAAVVSGRAAHAGRNPEDGRNAIVAAAELAGRVAALTGMRSGLTANPSRIEGGGPDNMVPEHAVLRFNLRLVQPEDQQWALAALDEAIADISRRHGVTIKLHGAFSRPPKPLDLHQQRLFELVRGCGAALGLDLAWKDSGGVCDGNNLAACGLAVVDTLGVRGGAIHSDQEFMIIDSLVERARLSTLLLMRLSMLDAPFSTSRTQ